MDFGGGWWWFPFAAAAGAFMLVVGVILFIFWIWMIVDCARRTFRNTTEKIVWLIAIALGSTLGALIYLIVIRMINPKGIAK